MFSATTEAATNISFQVAPPKPARPDQSPGNDSFAALVDSNRPADTNNDRAEQQSAAQRRSSDAAAAADDRRSRDAAAADQAARNDTDDRDAVARRDNADPDPDADAVQRSKAKPDAPKADDAKSSAKSSSDDSKADPKTDPAPSAQQDSPAATTPDATAVPVAVAIAPAAVPTATPASDKSTAPLAIAAAAIAASSATAEAAASASSGQTKTDSDTTASANTTATATGVAVKINVPATDVLAGSVNQPAAQTGTTAGTNGAMAATVAATAPAAPKTASPKSPAATQAGTAASDDSSVPAGTADPTATAILTATPVANNAAQQAAATGKPKAGNGVVDAVKADAAANPSSPSAANLSAHTHAAMPDAGQLLTGTSDAGLQAAGGMQPQFQVALASAAQAGASGVTAATDGAVPLSGLAMEIAASANSGKSRFEIRLDPADLGRIDVRIDVDRHGQVTSHLTVEKPETLSMLRQDAPQLQRALDDAGLKTGDGGLQFSLRDQSSSGQNNDNPSGRNTQRLIVSEEDSIPAAVAGRTYGRMLGSSSGVDIRV